MEVRERDYLFDNLKALMLFLVAFGHTLAPYVTTQDSILRYIMQYIYLFHMPLFFFYHRVFFKKCGKEQEYRSEKCFDSVCSITGRLHTYGAAYDSVGSGAV